MVKKEQFQGKETFKCEDCGLHYSDKQIAQDCENFCRTHKSCSGEITKKSIELSVKD